MEQVHVLLNAKGALYAQYFMADAVGQLRGKLANASEKSVAMTYTCLP